MERHDRSSWKRRHALVLGNTVNLDGTPSARLKARLDTAVTFFKKRNLIQVGNLAASVDYYTSKLGFTKIWEDEGFCIVSRDGCDVFFAQKQTEVDLRNSTARIHSTGYADYDYYFHCASGTIDELWKAFQTAEVIPDPFCEGPTDREYGIRDISISDPDGYRLVFGAPIQNAG